MFLQVLLSIALAFSLILPASAAGASPAMPRLDDCSISHSAVDSSSLASAMALNTPQGQVTPMVAAGCGHIVGLKSDGTVVAVGDNISGQCDAGNWTGIVQVATGGCHTVGVKSDGTVVAVGAKGTVPVVNDYGQCDVGDWMDIVQVAAGGIFFVGHTVGVKTNGTVVAAGPEIALAKRNLGVIEYALTISNTAGGSVTTPDEGVFIYNAGVMIRVIAEPEKGYRFANWTGDVDTIANVNAATTMITMRGDYSITANFKEKPPTNWALIGGIIAAVVIVGLVIFFLCRRGRGSADI